MGPPGCSAVGGRAQRAWGCDPVPGDCPARAGNRGHTSLYAVLFPGTASGEGCKNISGKVSIKEKIRAAGGQPPRVPCQFLGAILNGGLVHRWETGMTKRWERRTHPVRRCTGTSFAAPAKCSPRRAGAWRKPVHGSDQPSRGPLELTSYGAPANPTQSAPGRECSLQQYHLQEAGQDCEPPSDVIAALRIHHPKYQWVSLPLAVPGFSSV